MPASKSTLIARSVRCGLTACVIPFKYHTYSIGYNYNKCNSNHMNNSSNKDNTIITGVTGDNSETAWSPITQQNTPSIKPDHQILRPSLRQKHNTSKPRQLTRKQQAFIKYLVDNPKASATQAVKNSYNVGTDLSARQQAHDNLTNPNILLELSKHSQTAELTVLKVMNYSSEKGERLDSTAGASYAATALQAANSLLDRLHGKATTRVEQTTTAVTLNIDLTGVAGEEK